MDDLTRIAGNNIYFEFETKNLIVSPPARINPDGGVQVSIFDPMGAKLVEASMVNVRLGIWSYAFQTTTSSTQGRWEAQVQTTHLGKVSLSRRYLLFDLIAS